MNKAIVKMYFRLVKAGKRSLEDLDEELREAVQTMIDEENAEAEAQDEDQTENESESE